MFNLGFVVNKFSCNVLLKNKTQGNYNSKGDYIRYPQTELPIKMAIQPTGGTAPANMLRDMPEGLRDEIRLVVWSTHELQTDDEFDYENESYRIMYAWPRKFGAFTKAVAGLKA